MVLPVSCVGGRAGDGGDVSFKRGLMVAVVVLLLVISFVRVKPVAPLLVCFLGVVKPVAPLLAENGCFLGETARQWCHWLHASAAWCCRWCHRFHASAARRRQWCRRFQTRGKWWRWWCRRFHASAVRWRRWCCRFHLSAAQRRQWCPRFHASTARRHQWRHWFHRAVKAAQQASAGKTKTPKRMLRGLAGGSDRRRSGDLSIFSRTLYQLSYRAKT